MDLSLGQAVLLGVLQGITEFLPISSSGHLVLGQHLLGLDLPGMTFEVVVHAGTLLAVLAAYRADLARLLGALLGRSAGGQRAAERQLLWAVVVGTLPAVVAGLLVKPVVDRLFSSLPVVGTGWLITAALLVVADRSLARGRTSARRKRAKGHEVTIGRALWIGLMQALAILPGVSRAGSTIAAGLLSGLEAEAAARFSFLLAIPAIAGAVVLDLGSILTELEGGGGAGGAPQLAAGFIAAAVMGYLAIAFLLEILRRGRLLGFAGYCAALGVLTLVLVR